MKKISFILILIALGEAMAQSCKISSTPKGMQIQNELPTENTDMSSFPNLGNTVDISGIVAEANIDLSTDPICMKAIPGCNVTVKYTQSESAKTSRGARAVLHNFKIHSEKETLMSKVADSTWILYPSDLELNIGDTLYVKNYSALYYNVWDENTHCDYVPKLSAVGEYTVIQGNHTQTIHRLRTAKDSKSKTFNRDASGRFSTNNNCHIIKY